jgi:hypothetical protein
MTRTIRRAAAIAIAGAALGAVAPANAAAFPGLGTYYCNEGGSYANVTIKLKPRHKYTPIIAGKKYQGGKWAYKRPSHKLVFKTGGLASDYYGRQHRFNGKWDPEGFDLLSKSDSDFDLACFK